MIVGPFDSPSLSSTANYCREAPTSDCLPGLEVGDSAVRYQQSLDWHRWASGELVTLRNRFGNGLCVTLTFAASHIMELTIRILQQCFGARESERRVKAANVGLTLDTLAILTCSFGRSRVVVTATGE
jgi:hypothetical protein